jgi:uncharacterized protein YecE (DUF72 family)
MADGIYIGTSGWNYRHWKGNFYPERIAAKNQLAYYQQYFDTVELNNSFYHLPLVTSVEGWYENVPRQFVFAVKASRFITHVKKLNVTEDVILELLQRMGHLKEKLGPVLFQLPPNWSCNPERLELLLKMLPEDQLYTFEFRNHDWYRDEIYRLLQNYNCAFCIYELAGHQSPGVVTADFVYIRLHGPGAGKYEGKYSVAQLDAWVKKCKAWRKEGKRVFLYFDNDQMGYAAMNALYMKEKLS